MSLQPQSLSPILPGPGWRPAPVTPSARQPGRRAPVAFDHDRYVDLGRDLLAEALATTRLGSKFTNQGLTTHERNRLVHRLIADARAGLDTLAQRLDDGSITLAAWHRRSADLLAAHHHATSMAGLGRSGLDVAERADIARTLNREIGYLNRFRGEIRAGVAGTADQIAARARMYGSALWAGSQSSRRQAAIRDGARFERRALGGAERSCSMCPDLAAQGWRPAGELPEIGETPCRTMCRCYWVTRKSDPLGEE